MTTTEPTLFDALTFDFKPSTTIAASFEEFHRLNPWVYSSLAALARELVTRGRKRIGIGMLFEVLRWHYYRTTTDPNSEFKLNNNYRSRYARLLMSQESDLADVFETRGLRAP